MIPPTTVPTIAPTVAPERRGWTELTAPQKRERILNAAIAVFAERGLEAPMHLVAERAGAGVASIYRAFHSKHDLFAAIVVRRMDEITAACAEATRRPGDRWSALVWFITLRVRHQSPEPFTIEARAVVEDRPEVAESIARATAAQERLLDAARVEGRLRADATVDDIRLLFVATRAVRRLRPDEVDRMLELVLDSLEARRG